jgi:D-glycero-D-manno-heptose 1,7-bisphosphate phosphatase
MSMPGAFDSAGRPAVFLDRDGVLIRALVRDGRPYPPRTLNQVEILDGVADACRCLAAAGAVLVVATNQPDLARGAAEVGFVEGTNRHLRDVLGLHDIRMCPHDDSDGCDCRKPKPGLLLRAACLHGLDLPRSVMVGDRWRDIEAGRRAGCRTVFIDHGYREPRPNAPDLTCRSLAQAVPFILATIQLKAAP